MKRISLLPGLFLLVFCVSAYGDYHPPIALQYRLHWSPYTQSLVGGEYRYRPYGLRYKSAGLASRFLQYSPYAFEYGKSGLTCNDEQYSPYAFKYNNSGLVPYYTYYSPYLFSYGNPGLISYNSYYSCAGGYDSSGINVLMSGMPEYSYQENYTTESYYDYGEKINKQEYEAHKEAIEQQKAKIEKNRQLKAEDPSEAIRQILESKKIKFNTNNTLLIDGKTVSISFNLEDTNIIIKFWNSREISELSKNDDYKKRAYQNYLKSWEEYCLKYVGNSKKVYNIISGDREEIYNQLAQNSDLNSDDILYAKSQN